MCWAGRLGLRDANDWGAPYVRNRVVEIVHHLEDLISLALGLITKVRDSALLELELRVECGHLRLESRDLSGYKRINSVASLHLVVEGCTEIGKHPLDANLKKFDFPFGNGSGVIVGG